MTWKPTTKWKPASASGSAPTAVENSEGALGLAKPRGQPKEKLASDLGQLAGVRVPLMEVAAIEGKNGQFAISRVHSPESTDLRQVRAHAADLFNSNEVQDAIRNASGLAAFYSWTGTSDQKDDHLVLDTNGPGNYLVTGVDFESAFSWSDTDKGQIQDHGLPPAMNGKIDKSKVAEAVAKIEGISDEQIRQAVNANPDLPAAEKPRIADGLIERRSKLREKMKARGWLD